MKKQCSKRMTKFIGALISVWMLVGCAGNGQNNKDISAEANNITKDVWSKVRFEGIGTIKGESTSEIAHTINEIEAEQTKLIIQLDNDYDSFVERPDENDMTVEEAQTILREQRANVKEYYAKTNKEILESLDLSEFAVEFEPDSYAPFIVGEFENEITADDIDNIYELAENEIISTIYVKKSKKVENELTSAVNAIDGTDIVNNSSTNGNGIVIGIFEGGIVDKNSDIFDGVDLKVRDELWYKETVTEHTTMVAACALAIAPGASILSVEQSGEFSSEIGWMLDNDVNIINMSFSYFADSELGEYSSVSAYCDYIARNNWVTFIGSAGNRGDTDQLVTPPNGYNTITVGACTDSGERCNFSSYKENCDIAFPKLLAPGRYIYIPTFSGAYNGTSFAAPITAGSVAVLMQDTPALITFPEHILSVLMASTQRISQYATNSGFDDEAGTGMLNLENALKAVDNRKTLVVHSDNVGEYISSKTVYLKAGQRIRIAFASLVNNGATQTANLVTDYDLYLFNSNGKVVESCLSTYNSEFIDFVATSSGYYTIKIKQYYKKRTTLTDFCSYTYFIQ